MWAVCTYFKYINICPFVCMTSTSSREVSFLERREITGGSLPSLVGFRAFSQATKALRLSRGIALLFLGPRHSRWGGVSLHAPAASSPWKKTVTHCTGGWVCPRACLDGRKIGIWSRTVQPVVRSYIDWATGPTVYPVNLPEIGYYRPYFMRSFEMNLRYLFLSIFK